MLYVMVVLIFVRGMIILVMIVIVDVGNFGENGYI